MIPGRVLLYLLEEDVLSSVDFCTQIIYRMTKVTSKKYMTSFDRSHIQNEWATSLQKRDHYQYSLCEDYCTQLKAQET